MLRQGDVFIVPLSKIPPDQIQYPTIPAEAKPVPAGPHGILLADGKATGNKHRIDSASAALFLHDGVRFLRADETVQLVHEEHGTIEIPAGEYRVSGHHEAAPGELPRQVED